PELLRCGLLSQPVVAGVHRPLAPARERERLSLADHDASDVVPSVVDHHTYLPERPPARVAARILCGQLHAALAQLHQVLEPGGGLVRVALTAAVLAVRGVDVLLHRLDAGDADARSGSLLVLAGEPHVQGVAVADEGHLAVPQRAPGRLGSAQDARARRGPGAREPEREPAQK